MNMVQDKHNNSNNNSSSSGTTTTATAAAAAATTSRTKQHAGAVHVRGMMIRRWRPRYLELDEDGVLRYYEATEDNNSMSSSSATTTHRKRKKSVKKTIAAAAASISVSKRQSKSKSIHRQQHSNDHNNENEHNTTSSTSKHKQHPLKGIGGSNKEFVHITNDDIMNREMQAFSLPQQLNCSTASSVNAAMGSPGTTSTSTHTKTNTRTNTTRISATTSAGDSNTGTKNNNNNQKLVGSQSLSVHETDQEKKLKEHNNNSTSDLEDLIYDPSDDDDIVDVEVDANIVNIAIDTDTDNYTDAKILNVADNDTSSGEVVDEDEDEDEDEARGIVVTHDMHVKVLNHNGQIQPPGKSSTHDAHNHRHEYNHSTSSGSSSSSHLSKNKDNEKAIEDVTIVEEEEEEDVIMSTLQLHAQHLHHHVHKHRAKAVMTILSARIIDINSLRDIHVGLPKGTFGFVFCGRQIFSNSDNSTNNNTIHGMDANEDDQNDIRDDVCHPLSILSSDHDYFDTSRDYLCSVNTLEEAQTWVSALRWAANVSSMRSARQRLNNSRGGLLPCDPYIDDNSFSDESSLDRTISADSLRSIRSPPRTCNYLSGLRRNCNLLENLLIEDDRSACTDEHVSPPSRTEGITIVTKVKKIGFELNQRHRVFGFKCGIKYEVKMLLLRSIHLNDRSKKRRKEGDGNGGGGGEGKKWSVEERTIYQSYNDFIELVEKLLEEFGDSKAQIPSHKGGGKEDVLQVLEKTRSGLSHDPDLRPESSNVLRLHTKIKSSIESVDKVLRTLTTDNYLCNTSTIKDFLLKEKSSRQTTTSPAIHQKLTSLFNDNSDTRKKTLDIVVGDSTDEFVKKWLFGVTKEDQYNKVKATIIMLHNPFVESIVTVVVIAFLCQMYIIWSRHLRHRTSVRLDLLLIQASFIFYCGFKMGTSRTQKRQVITISNDGAMDENKMKRLSQRKTVEKSKKTRQYTVMSTKTDSGESMEIEEDVGFTSDEPLLLSSPLPHYSKNSTSSWSSPMDTIFNVRGKTYLTDRVKIPSDTAPFTCRGIDMWLTNNPERHIARHPSVLGGNLGKEDTFIVNFLLPFGNFVAYFSIPPISEMPKNIATVWTKFINGNQQYRDARLKLLPVVIDGPWIVKKAVGHGPALLGQAIPLQYYFTHPTDKKKGVYEVDVIITASRIAKGILSVVKSHTKRLSLAFGFIIEAAKESELPETVLCSCQIHSLHLEVCPSLPKYFLDDVSEDSCD